MSQTEWKFYTATNEAWEAMLLACKNAQHSILLEQYIFDNDSIGKKFVEVLINKAKQGVKIKLILDTAGSYYIYNSTLAKEMLDSGIEIRFWNIISPWRIKKIFSWYFRDHRKILIVDEIIGFTGGVGLDSEMTGWRDTLVEIRGNIVNEMIRVWLEMWNLTLEKGPIARFIATRKYTKEFEFITNAPYFGKRFLYHALIDALRDAKESIIITTPYFLPDNRLIRILKIKARRGVEVKIILPNINDVAVVGLASHTYYDDLIKSGVEIYHYEPTILHAKTIIVDKSWATLGSMNMDNLSFVYNHEANIISTEKSFIETLTQHAKEDILNSNKIELVRWRARSKLQKLKEFLIKPFRKIL